MLKKVMVGLIGISSLAIVSFAADNIPSSSINWSEEIIKLLLAPIIAFLIPIMWKLSSIPINKYREKSMRNDSLIEVKLDLSLDKDIFEKAIFKCLLIRFGTDSYIKDMASESEKHDGRLRNEIIIGSCNNGNLSYTIPLHKRIGTQFKCYLELETKDEIENIVDRIKIIENKMDKKNKEIMELEREIENKESEFYLENKKRIRALEKEILKEESPIYDLGISCSKDKNRLFFLIRGYGSTKTVDNLYNNMLFPI